jgi:hypothetical protein
MLCYILLYIQKDTSNFDNLILFFCERLIYILTYWCNPPPTEIDKKLTGDVTMRSQLGFLHNSTVTDNTPLHKTKNMVSALQKLYNDKHNNQ